MPAFMIPSFLDAVRYTPLSAAFLAFTLSTAAAEPVSFRRDVMAVLSKAGCNQGTCHGNQNGKNGFKLSLRGQEPGADWIALTRDTLARRVNRQRPEASLLLLKATAAVPHEGGKRFSAASLEYDLIYRWLAEGFIDDGPTAARITRLEVSPTEQILFEPADNVRLMARVHFADSGSRDVTRLAVYESSNPAVVITPDGEVRQGSRETNTVVESTILVRFLDKQSAVRVAFVPAGPGFVWQSPPENNFIDRHVFAKLKALRMNPSAVSPDHIFLRRAYLDAIGIPPTAEEARRFLDDKSADKRAQLIDKLLERPEFADFWALKWSDLLRNEEKSLDRKGVQVFHQWIRQAIADGKPLNEFARELIAARGSTYSHPPANFYRALRDPQARSEAVAQVFLGVRLQCAKCHNHPFDRWTQDDYYGLAAFFPRIAYTVVENKRGDRLDQHEFVGEQIVWLARRGEVDDPRTGAAASAHVLDRNRPPPAEDRLQSLADWIADPANPFFAKTQVNRIWHHLMGRGIVDPIDDFRVSNPPANAALLDALTADFVAHRFDLKHAVRTIMNSHTYQLSAAPNESNRDDIANFSHALVKPLQAEQLLDSVAQVAGVPVKLGGYPAGLRAGQVPAVAFYTQRDRRPTASEQFLKVFGKPERLLTCECERAEDTTLARALHLISGGLVNGLIAEKDNRLGQWISSGKSDAEIVNELYLWTLSRPPSPRDLPIILSQLENNLDRRAALEDLTWAVLNSKEFLLRQ